MFMSRVYVEVNKKCITMTITHSGYIRTTTRQRNLKIKISLPIVFIVLCTYIIPRLINRISIQSAAMNNNSNRKYLLERILMSKQLLICS